MDTIRIYGLVPDSIVDGPGLRYSIFVQGCTHNCEGCHNPESQPADGGDVMRIDDICNDILNNKLITGVTFSGGEPFEQPMACAKIAKRLKDNGLNIWAYTGYLFEDLFTRALQSNADAACSDGNIVNSTGIDAADLSVADTAQAILEFLSNIDVLVDGPFVQPLHSYTLTWRGSSNQRLIDVQNTLTSGNIIEWTQPSFEIDAPPSW